MSLSPSDKDLASEFKRRVETVCGSHLLEVRAFGSRARGESRVDSDLDLFVMLDIDDRGQRTSIAHVAYDIGLERDLPYTLEPLVMSRTHFDDLVRAERLIAQDILREGVSI